VSIKETDLGWILNIILIKNQRTIHKKMNAPKQTCCKKYERNENLNNNFCNYCGCKIRDGSNSLHDEYGRPLLRRSTAYLACLKCGINGERSEHGYCGHCGDELVSVGDNNNTIMNSFPPPFPSIV
jgi:hypothetical protein